MSDFHQVRLVEPMLKRFQPRKTRFRSPVRLNMLNLHAAKLVVGFNGNCDIQEVCVLIGGEIMV
jgi:hypothetical protein